MSTLVRGAREMPTLGPEALDLIFRLGCLTTAQLQTLLPARRSPSQVRRITKALRHGSLIESVRRPYPYSRPQIPQPTAQQASQPVYEGTAEPVAGAGPMESGSLGPSLSGGATDGSRRSPNSPHRWTQIHFLTEKGLSLVARTRDLYPSVAKSLYARVLDEARVYHALLRNEFYSWLVEELTAARATGGTEGTGVGIETLCAESGYTPMRLADGRKNKTRYLNPDGVLELGDDTDPAFYERVLIESDTGSQDMPWQITSKAEKFAEYVSLQLGELDLRGARSPGHTFQVLQVPKLLFVSPGVARSRWVREAFVENAQKSGTVFREVRARVRDSSGVELADAVLFTNFAWLSKRGTLGKAYWALSSNELGSLTVRWS